MHRIRNFNSQPNAHIHSLNKRGVNPIDTVNNLLYIKATAIIPKTIHYIDEVMHHRLDLRM